MVRPRHGKLLAHVALDVVESVHRAQVTPVVTLTGVPARRVQRVAETGHLVIHRNGVGVVPSVQRHGDHVTVLGVSVDTHFMPQSSTYGRHFPELRQDPK